jgi:uncharacterized membrane protein YqjE
MDTDPSAPSGFLASILTLVEGLLAGVQDRLELASIELQEEKFRLIRTFVWVSAIVFLAMMAILFASLTVVYLFSEGARLAVLGGFAALYAAALVVIIFAFRRYLARQPRPFSATMQELTEDRACIRNRS